MLKSDTHLRAQIDEDVGRGTRNLVRRVGSADGLHLTADGLNSWRHFSYALFNIMRGGIPVQGYFISRADFQATVRRLDVYYGFDASGQWRRG